MIIDILHDIIPAITALTIVIPAIFLGADLVADHKTFPYLPTYIPSTEEM